MLSEVKTLVVQFALVIGLWVIAHFVWTRFVRKGSVPGGGSACPQPGRTGRNGSNGGNPPLFSYDQWRL